MGFLRLFLALSVIAGHSETTTFGFKGIGAWYAVNFFFIISGFYMALVLNENKIYQTNVISFYKSRFLRLFPVYYMGLILGIVVSWSAIVKFFFDLSLSGKIFYIFQNLFIFGQDLAHIVCVSLNNGSCAERTLLTINIAAWSIPVELGFYLIAPLFLRNIRRILLLFFIGGGYLLIVNNFLQIPVITERVFRILNLNFLNYFFYPASYVFFASGALSYHVIYKNFNSIFIYPILLSMVLLLSFTKTIMPFWHLLFITISIPVIFQYTKSNKFDRFIGELSYPVYIVHYPILIFLRQYTNQDKTIWLGFSTGTWVGIFSCMLGIILWYFIDKKIEAYRHRSIEKNFKYGTLIPKLSTAIYTGFLVFSLLYMLLYSKFTIQAFNLTDKNWKNGISLHNSAFFIHNVSNNKNSLKVGDKLKFASSGERRITNIKYSNKYINIFVDGAKLDPIKDGYPNKIIKAEEN